MNYTEYVRQSFKEITTFELHELKKKIESQNILKDFETYTSKPLILVVEDYGNELETRLNIVKSNYF